MKDPKTGNRRAPRCPRRFVTLATFTGKIFISYMLNHRATSSFQDLGFSLKAITDSRHLKGIKNKNDPNYDNIFFYFSHLNILHFTLSGTLNNSIRCSKYLHWYLELLKEIVTLIKNGLLSIKKSSHWRTCRSIKSH